MQIKFAQQRDSGAYECQVNTVPKMSMTFQLNVVGNLLNVCRNSLLYNRSGED
ncbi:defective proboscis extension response, partial [Culex quinquefasciatus]